MFSARETDFVRSLIDDFSHVSLHDLSQEVCSLPPVIQLNQSDTHQLTDQKNSQPSSRPHSHHGCSQDHSKEIQIFEKSNKDKLAAIEALRSEGNKKFKAGFFEEALGSYRLALAYFDYSFPEGDSEQAAFDNAKIKCHLNVAATLEKLKLWNKVASECEHALRIESGNSKALYRMANAQVQMDQFEDGELFLRKVEAVEPEDAAVRALRVELNRKMETYDRKSKEVASKMLLGDDN